MNLFQRYIIHGNKLSLLLAFIIVNQIISITFSLGILYYLIMFCLLFICIFKGGIEKINVSGLILIIILISSILFNNIPSFFKPWERLTTYTILILLTGPILESDFLNKFRINVFYQIFLFLQPVIIISFLLYLIRFPLAFHFGLFRGITEHSMTMGPCAAITLLFSLYRLLSIESKKLKYYYICLGIISFLSLMLAASRAAFMGAIVGIIILLFFQKKFKLSYYVKIGVIIGALAMISINIWMPYAQPLIAKNENNIAAGGMLNSRENAWRSRFEEFKSSPIIGIGFGAIDTSSNKGSTFSRSTGKVETGSSWLNILSMTGLLGAICIAYFIVKAFNQQKVVGLYDKDLSCLFYSVLFFWAVHMLAEGYIFAAGSFMTFEIWILFGAIDGIYHKLNSSEQNYQL